uniref:Putative secreted protein n=1 Tax=Anopheles darlingi TaxID=43151 RepID=A0A2M4DN65_ANODA
MHASGIFGARFRWVFALVIAAVRTPTVEWTATVHRELTVMDVHKTIKLSYRLRRVGPGPAGATLAWIVVHIGRDLF